MRRQLSIDTCGNSVATAEGLGVLRKVQVLARKN
jgi:hypothetical protein